MAKVIAVAEFEDKEVRAFLKNLYKKLSEIKDGKKKYVGLLSAIVFKDINLHFQQEMGSEGRWKDWSPTYQEHMESIGRSGNQILQFSGKLRQGFKPEKVKTSKNAIMWFNDEKTKDGFPYAYAHDTGGPQLPKRDFMWLSDQAMNEISEQTLQFMIDEGI